MRILVAPDKFKGSLTAPEVCAAIAKGLRQKYPHDEIILFPLADGGEGTFEILTHHTNGRFVTARARDPLFRNVDAQYGISADSSTAFIEIAAASGLRLLAKDEYNVMETSTLGTGDLIADAIDKGVTNVVLGIGGSATNDGGAGAAHALGYEFLNDKKLSIVPTGKSLVDIKSIRTSNVHPKLRDVKFTAICDVTNPLVGAQGAAYVYALQKGASSQQLPLLDEGLRNLARVVKTQFGIEVDNTPGAGAGGGFGAGVLAFLHGTLQRGADVMFDLTGFEAAVAKADVIITGEGKLDEQTLHGKVVSRVSAIARRLGKKVICMTGSNHLSVLQLKQMNIAQVFSLTEKMDEAFAMNNASPLLEEMSRGIEL